MEKKINKYVLNRDSEGYICGFYTVLEGAFDFEGQMADHCNACLGYTKFENGMFIEDDAKRTAIENEKAKQVRIVELKAYLASTDYIYNSIREGGRTEEYYAEVIEQRKAARSEIQELEGK